MKLTTEMTRRLNVTMKTANRHHKWKVSSVGSFVAAKAATDTTVSDAVAAKNWLEANYNSFFDLKGMTPVITQSLDGTTLINWMKAVS